MNPPSQKPLGILRIASSLSLIGLTALLAGCDTVALTATRSNGQVTKVTNLDTKDVTVHIAANEVVTLDATMKSKDGVSYVAIAGDGTTVCIDPNNNFGQNKSGTYSAPNSATAPLPNSLSATMSFSASTCSAPFVFSSQSTSLSAQAISGGQNNIRTPNINFVTP